MRATGVLCEHKADGRWPVAVVGRRWRLGLATLARASRGYAERRGEVGAVVGRMVPAGQVSG